MNGLNPESVIPDFLPSPPVSLEIACANERVPVLVPREETWRVKKIFLENEYSIPPILLHDQMLVVDLGANGGLFAVYAKLKFAHSAVIHCFEPCPAAVNLLRQNLAPFEGTHVHPIAVSNHDGEATLYLHGKNSGQNSIKQFIQAEYPFRIPVVVRDAGRVFDELGLREIDVLKIDTEGSELDILESLGPRLNKVRCILAEYHSRSHRRLIDALLTDFELFEIRPWPSLAGGVVKYLRPNLIAPRGNQS